MRVKHIAMFCRDNTEDQIHLVCNNNTQRRPRLVTKRFYVKQSIAQCLLSLQVDLYVGLKNVTKKKKKLSN